MGGKGSGRKTSLHDFGAAETAREVLKLSLYTLHRVLSDPNESIENKLKCAVPIANKYFPEKVLVSDVNALTLERKEQMVSAIRAMAEARLNVISITPIK